MIIRKILPEEKEIYNSVISHPLQSWQWGEFKKRTGMRVIRLGVFEKGKIIGGFQILFRSISKLSLSVGQLLKCPLPDGEVVGALKELAEEQKAIFIKVEPDYVVRRWDNFKGKVQKPPAEDKKIDLTKIGLELAEKPFFDPYSFGLDLTKTEEELLANMAGKTRYNIRLAQRNGLAVEEKSDQEGLEIFINLLQETLKRQKFFLHSPGYFEKMWKVLAPAGISHILLAKHKDKILNAWMLFTWKNRIFYPYGASSSENRNLMGSNLICWEAIRFGKKLGCKSFDMWGGLGPDADPKDPWFGFHKFKLGYGGDLVKFVGSWDLVLNKPLYRAVHFANSIRWGLLHLRRKLPF